MRYNFIIPSIIIMMFVTLLTGCHSSDLTKNLTAEERFEIGKNKFIDENYLEAISEFEIVKLQFPASAVADDAQYYLAECRFKLEEFLLAAVDYQELKNNMPASPLVPVAQYKIGLSYYKLAPKSSLDQQYTRRAIDEFQAFIEYYPKDEMVADATSKINELNDRLAKKIFDSAELYMKMEYFKSATIYYTSVIERYHDTKFAEPSLLGRVKSLIARMKYSEARQDIERFFEKYPNSELKNEAESLQREINDNNKETSSTLNSKS
jgi:outer membrane protein assembly factor BamD